MIKFLKLKLILIAIALLTMLSNCDLFLLHENKPGPEGPPIIYRFPSTNKESKYLHYLDSLGLTKISGGMTMPKYKGDIYDTGYSIDMEKKHMNKTELDSIDNFFYSQLQYLYSNIIEDSIIYSNASYAMYVHTNRKHYFNHTSIESSQINLTRDSLEKLCGFKVVKVSKNEYKRVPVLRTH